MSANDPSLPSELKAVQDRFRHGLAIIIFVAAGVAFYYYFIGFYGSDDLQYAGGIRLFAGLSGGEIVDLGSLRFVLVLPAAFLSFLGNSVEWSFASQFLYYAGTGALMYALLARVANQSVAVATSLGCLTLPSVIIFAPSLLPDIVLAFYLLLHALLVDAVHRRRASRPLALLFLSGLAAGGVYASKEVAVIYLLPWFVFLALTFFRMGLATLTLAGASYIAGLALVVGADGALQYAVTGELLPRLLGGLDAAQVAQSLMVTQGHTPATRLQYALSRLDRSYPFLLLIAATPILYLLSLLVRSSRNGFALAAVLFAGGFWIFLYNTFGSISLREFIGVPIQERYYAPSAILLLMAAAIVLFDILCATVKPNIGKGIAVTIFAMVALWQVSSTFAVAGSVYGASNYRAAAFAVSVATATERLPIYFEPWLYQRTRYGTLDRVLPLPRDLATIASCRFWAVTKEGALESFANFRTQGTVITQPGSRADSLALAIGLGPRELQATPYVLHLMERIDCV